MAVCDKWHQSMIHLASSPQYRPRLRAPPNLTNSHASLNKRQRPRPRTVEVAKKLDDGE